MFLVIDWLELSKVLIEKVKKTLHSDKYISTHTIIHKKSDQMDASEKSDDIHPI